MPQQPGKQHPHLVTAEQVHREFLKLLRDRNHMGVRKLVGDVVLESRNPFQRMRRRPRKWVVAAGGIILLGFMIAGYFHLR